MEQPIVLMDMMRQCAVLLVIFNVQATTSAYRVHFYVMAGNNVLTVLMKPTNIAHHWLHHRGHQEVIKRHLS
jgi:hypothetical protein